MEKEAMMWVLVNEDREVSYRLVNCTRAQAEEAIGQWMEDRHHKQAQIMRITNSDGFKLNFVPEIIEV